MNDPNKPPELLIDEVIEQEVDRWIETRQREPEQMELIEEDNNGN